METQNNIKEDKNILPRNIGTAVITQSPNISSLPFLVPFEGKYFQINILTLVIPYHSTCLTLRTHCEDLQIDRDDFFSFFNFL